MPRQCPVCKAATEALEMETATGRTTKVLALAAVDTGGTAPAVDLATVLSVHAYICGSCGHIELVSARWTAARGS